MSRADTARVKEYRHVSALLARPDSGLGDVEKLELARRLTQLAPAQADSWWSVATQIQWMLTDVAGALLREHPLFPELISAWDQAIELDSTDAATPYNKARNLERAGLREDAYTAYMLAGRTETAHPSDIEWPAHWHFEHAVFVALEDGRDDLALEAARAAIDGGAADIDQVSLIQRICGEGDSRRPI